MKSALAVRVPGQSSSVRAPARRSAWISVLLALAVVAAVALGGVLLGGSTSPGVPHRFATPARVADRPDGGPSESAVAAAVAPRISTGPDESATAASLAGAATRTYRGPDESRTAAAIAAHRLR